MADMMAADPGLAERVLTRGVKTVLCVGNGLSAEAHVLVTWGFDVTVLDLSLTAPEMYSRGSYGDNHPMHRSPAFTGRARGSLTWLPLPEPTVPERYMWRTHRSSECRHTAESVTS